MAKGKPAKETFSPAGMSVNHIPVLLFLIKYLGVKSGVEYGAGCHSSPALAGALEAFVSIESNEHWVRHVSKETGLPIRSHRDDMLLANKCIVHFPMPMPRHITYRDMTEHYGSVIDLYHELFACALFRFDFGMLFIDGYGGTRHAALERWSQYARSVIVCHDVEKKARYGYDTVDIGLPYLEYRPKEGYWTGIHLRGSDAEAEAMVVAAKEQGIVLYR